MNLPPTDFAMTIPPTPLQELQDSLFDAHQLKVFVKRFDLMHPHVSGNKIFKLKHNIAECKAQNKDNILTFGGAYSNHIIATAAIGKEHGIKTIGIIRGEETIPLNNVLTFAIECGMELHYITRERYRIKDTEAFISSLTKQHGDFYLIPEGGANIHGIKGCMEMSNEIEIPFDYIALACGTGTTLAGISLSLNDNQKAIGIPVLKGAEFMQQSITNMRNQFSDQLGVKENFALHFDYHFGGYAKTNDALNGFIQDFIRNHFIPIEYVYTGKLFYAVFDLIKQGYFPKGSTLVVLHTGGLFNAGAPPL